MALGAIALRPLDPPPRLLVVVDDGPAICPGRYSSSSSGEEGVVEVLEASRSRLRITGIMVDVGGGIKMDPIDGGSIILTIFFSVSCIV